MDLSEIDQSAAYRIFFDDAPIGMALVDLKGRWLRVNHALCDILGYAPDELLARDFQAITHPEDLSADLDLVDRLLDGSLRAYQIEKRYYRKDGSVVWTQLSVSLIRTAAGAPLCFASQIQDITAQKDHVEALRSSEQRFRAVFEHAVQAMAIVHEGIVGLCNPAFAVLFGYDETSDASGVPFTALIAPEDRRRIGQVHEARLADSEAPSDYETVGHRRDGSEFPMEGHISTFGRDDRHYLIAHLRDTTAQRQHEEQLRHRNRVLERDNHHLKVLATADPLTGLFNRRVFLERLNAAFRDSRSSGQPLALLMLDVDYFKKYNDTYGHVEGDHVLQTVAKVLMRSARESDTVARYGGEEFAILLPETSASGAAALAERIREGLAETDWPLRRITISIGGAVIDTEMTNPTDMIIDADSALYHAKSQGRDRAAFHP